MPCLTSIEFLFDETPSINVFDWPAVHVLLSLHASVLHQSTQLSAWEGVLNVSTTCAPCSNTPLLLPTNNEQFQLTSKGKSVNTCQFLKELRIRGTYLPVMSLELQGSIPATMPESHAQSMRTGIFRADTGRPGDPRPHIGMRRPRIDTINAGSTYRFRPAVLHLICTALPG